MDSASVASTTAMALTAGELALQVAGDDVVAVGAEHLVPAEQQAGTVVRHTG
jgi:hypothetical protein